MPYLFEIILFLLPFAVYGVWRWLNPGIEPGPSVILAGVAGVILMIVFAIWYGLSVSMAPHAPYVPAQLGHDGRVIQGQPEPAR